MNLKMVHSNLNINMLMAIVSQSHRIVQYKWNLQNCGKHNKMMDPVYQNNIPAILYFWTKNDTFTFFTRFTFC